ncbi:MAG: aminotransferase class IV [Anaerolineae bacterium]|nr:aminotransferase class IV [Anaerolineae bacterium]MDW8298911.1 aminotransferase class IV [Anaerolineae bacterium]
MGIPIGILTPEGLHEAPYSAESLAEAVPFEPEGVYTITRTFNRDHVLMFDEHLDRLEESARLENIPLHLDRAAIRAALRTLIERSGYPESRFRITVPRAQPDHIYLSVEPFKPIPPELIQRGVRVVTVPLVRHNPSAKTTAWMTERKMAPLPEGAYEGVLVSPEGFLLEGTSSNFYAVMDGELRTAGEGVLCGIVRRAILELAPNYLPVRLEPVHKSELWALEEAFLTSASRGVVPIVMIDGQIIADGKPGAQTMWLREAYEEWAQAHLTPL